MTNSRELELLPKLELELAQRNWDGLSKLLKPKLFATIEPGELVSFKVLAKVAQILTDSDDSIPDSVKIACLKCLGNACLNGYKYKKYSLSNIEPDKHCHKLYSVLSHSSEHLQERDSEICTYFPHDSHFPYEGIAEWACDYIVSCSLNIKELLSNQTEILRLSIQFLCNLFTFACKENNFPDHYDIPNCLNNITFKSTVMNYIHCEYDPVVKACCMFVHNALKNLPESYFTETEKQHLCCQLLKPIKKGFQSAKEALLILLYNSNVLQCIYETVPSEDKLFLLEIIYNEVSESAYQSENENVANTFGEDTIKFLTDRFCKRSDLILKTVDTYMDGLEPTEIMILLDILGVLTVGDSKDHNFVKDDKNLLINCAYLLKSIQMVGKESNNCFTPMQKLSDVAPGAQGITVHDRDRTDSNAAESVKNSGEAKSEVKSDPHTHPAFGFKAGLIRVIGNMSYRNKMCQDLLRDTDTIPLLLDCCNIDARNPLIIQWIILALRNLCEENPENQEIIRNCTKVGVVQSSTLKEMGLTLNEGEDGQKIGIMPLIRSDQQ